MRPMSSTAVALDSARLEKLTELRRAVELALEGKPEAVELALVALFGRGHVLIEDVPGVGKTTLARALAKAIGGQMRRVQFTSDLLPSDVLGVSVYDQRLADFVLRKGPIFSNVLLADEINRASPRTQSALLQAMQEHHVTIAGQRHDLPQPFHVLATQNPIEQEGTYPLPEAQLDRFLMQIDVLYPDIDAERRMLFETTGAEETRAQPVLSGGELLRIQNLVRRMPVGEAVVEAILRLVRAVRPGEASRDIAGQIAWGPGPRASQALMLTVRARALLDGRFAPSLDDLEALAVAVLQHRMAVTFAARADGVSVRDLINQALTMVL
jgi:MoxR-like ATPase